MSVDFFLGGFEHKAETINLSNTNAAAMMRILGIPPSPEGHLLPAEIPPVQQRIMMLLNTDQYKEHVRPTVELAPNHIVCGIDEDYVRRRLEQFRDLFKVAQESGETVYWN